MKKVVIVVAMMLLMVSLSACGSSGGSALTDDDLQQAAYKLASSEAASNNETLDEMTFFQLVGVFDDKIGKVYMIVMSVNVQDEYLGHGENCIISLVNPQRDGEDVTYDSSSAVVLSPLSIDTLREQVLISAKEAYPEQYHELVFGNELAMDYGQGFHLGPTGEVFFQ